MEYHIRFGQGVMSVPGWWFDALLIWLAVMGLVLFLFGRRLVRPAFALLGLLGGAAFMLLVAHTLIAQQWPGSPPLPFVIIGGLIGALVLFILWRLGIGMVMAATVALVAPTVFVIAQGIEPPPLHEPIVAAWGEMGKILTDSSAPNVEMKNLPVILEPLTVAQSGVAGELDHWWAAQSTDTRWIAGLLCIGGAAVAMFIGFALPKICASLVTSLLGVLLMLGGIYRGVGLMGETAASLLPRSPRYIMLAILIGTVIGAIIQWMFSRRKADKQ